MWLEFFCADPSTELLVLYRLQITARKRFDVAAGLDASCTYLIAAVVLIVWVGAEKAIQRFSEIPKGEVNSDRRISMFRGAAGVFFDHPIKGSGLGTLVAVYPRHETLYDGLVVEHVHNDYIESMAAWFAPCAAEHG